VVSSSARLGLGRLFGTLAGSGLPPRSRDEVSAKMATAKSLRSTIDEYLQPSAAGQAAALTDFADKPLVVLTAGSGHDAAETAAQNRLATLSTNSVHRVIAGATHVTLIAEHRDAAETGDGPPGRAHRRRPLALRPDGCATGIVRDRGHERRESVVR
jgi:hypothetical protein